MRLLHTTTYEMRYFDSDVPPYAILSHTWGMGEVAFQNITSEYSHELNGRGKIERSCRYAIADGWEYIWIDTCCIDKTDTTELSKAINSMFRWYEKA
jgi:hypothetical protein